jgi:hypothetical protein
MYLNPCSSVENMRDEPRTLLALTGFTTRSGGNSRRRILPDTYSRREAPFRRYKWLNYLRCCRAANRSATVEFALIPAAAAIAAAMLGSSSAVFAPLNALAFMSRTAARSLVC